MVLPRHDFPTVTSDAPEHSLVRYQVSVLALLERYREPEDWWAQARCRGEGTDRFFPPLDRQSHVPRDLREFCGQCPVHAQCAEASARALAGIWAGRMRRANSRTALPGVAPTRSPRVPQAALAG